MGQQPTWQNPAQQPLQQPKPPSQFDLNPAIMGNLQQQGQDWLNQFGQAGQNMGNIAGNLGNWNTQNPYQGQLGAALNQMAGGGFNQDWLSQFQAANNPNNQGYGGGNYGGGGTPGWQNLPTQSAPPPSPQTNIGFGNGNTGQYPQNPGGSPPSGMPFAPGVQPQQGGGAPGGQVGGQPSNPFGVGLNQAQSPGTTTGFTGTPTTAPTPQAPTQGAGGAYNANMLGGGQQAAGQFGGFGADVGTAQQAQLGGLLNQAQGTGMSQQQQDQMFAAQYDPAAQAINQSQNNALSQLSARGMGRSSAGVGNVEGERMQALGNVAQQAGANVTGQNLALQQQQAQFGLSGLGQYAGQGMQGALGAGNLQNQMQGTANQMNLGMGNLGLGSEQLGTGNQMQMNQQQMQAQQQQFQQDNARAGLDLARYQTEQGFNMQQYQADLQARVASGQLDEQTAARMANNALQTTQLGLQAQGMQNQNNQALINSLLGAGNQNLDYSGQNLQAQLGAGGLYGNQMGQLGGQGMNAQQLYQMVLNQQANRNLQNDLSQGGGIGGFFGNLIGTGAGAFTGGLGYGLGSGLGGG